MLEKIGRISGWSFIAVVLLSTVMTMFFTSFISETYKEVVYLYLPFFLIFFWLFYMGRKRGVNFYQLFFKKPRNFTAKDFINSIIIVLVYQVFCTAFLALIAYLLRDLQFVKSLLSTASESMFLNQTVVSIVFIFINGAFFAPIVEEILFRGYLFPKMSIKRGVVFGAIVSSLIFGLLHLSTGFFAAIIGLICALYFIRTGSLIIPIFIHILNNLISVSGMLVRPNSDINLSVLTSSEIIFLILSLIVSASIILLFFIKNLPKKITLEESFGQ